MYKKKKKKTYISCRGIQKFDYQKALLNRYNIIFTDNPEDADFFLAPIDTDGLSPRQKDELERAYATGIETQIIDATILLDPEIDDPLDYERDSEELDLDDDLYTKDRDNKDHLFDDDEDFGLELY